MQRPQCVAVAHACVSTAAQDSLQLKANTAATTNNTQHQPSINSINPQRLHDASHFQESLTAGSSASTQQQGPHLLMRQA